MEAEGRATATAKLLGLRFLRPPPTIPRGLWAGKKLPSQPVTLAPSPDRGPMPKSKVMAGSLPARPQRRRPVNGARPGSTPRSRFAGSVLADSVQLKAALARAWASRGGKQGAPRTLLLPHLGWALPTKLRWQLRHEWPWARGHASGIIPAPWA